MSQTFEEIFNKIKNTETENSQKLNKITQESKKLIEDSSEQKNIERLEKIKKINLEIENYFAEEKQKIAQNLNTKKQEIETQILDLKANFEKNKPTAINELFTEFLK